MIESRAFGANLTHFLMRSHSVETTDLERSEGMMTLFRMLFCVSTSVGGDVHYRTSLVCYLSLFRKCVGGLDHVLHTFHETRLG